jgi:DNA-binding MarR family transcriptional regulator
MIPKRFIPFIADSFHRRTRAGPLRKVYGAEGVGSIDASIGNDNLTLGGTPPPSGTAGGSRPRLGRVEQVIVDELHARGGVTPREWLVRVAFPARHGAQATDATLSREARARAEAAVSRAIRSLEEKGFVVRERDARTRRTSVRVADQTSLPRWEQLARAEEDLAAHCRQRAHEWQQLAGRATKRASRLRSDQSSAGTEEDRRRDIERIESLEQRRS